MENPNHKWRLMSLGKSSISTDHLYHGYVNSPEGIYIYPIISPQFPFIFANFWEPSTFLSSTFLCQSRASMLPKARPPDASVVTQRTSPAADGRDHLTNCKNPKTHQHHRHRPHQTRGTPQDFRPSARNCADSTM